MKKELNLSFRACRGISLLLLIFFLIGSLSCDKNDDDNNGSQNPIDQLPPATQTGENTAGCLVNGEAFLPNNGSIQPLVLNYLNGEDFTLGISREVNGSLYTIRISQFNIPLQEGETYLLNTEFTGSPSSAQYIINTFPPPSPNYYSTNSMVTGELTITSNDFNNAILSGTFWFDAINSEGDIVEVREGRFDIQL
ncbi:MAG: hypothetical protein HRU50_11915 [Winogradskyella sp.]|uniref:DUF6252 family protein n=1 Tax=Winogradskyella sp. TaxID=1883156 RepID=UPI0025F36670|nr:DUF6252 family protein [Winogradskyella sp.]NRB60630.1 hypothetical protein [Winogradskyella sp.]